MTALSAGSKIIWLLADYEAMAGKFADTTFTDRQSLFYLSLRESTDIEPQLAAYAAPSTLQASRWTDACLTGFADCTGHCLVSFDAEFHTFPALDFLNLQPA